MEDKEHPKSTQTTEPSPVSPTKSTADSSIPTLPTNELETPLTTNTLESSHPQIPLSNLAASSITTVELNAKLAMSTTSQEKTSIKEIFSSNTTPLEETILPDFGAGQKKPSLRMSASGEELEKEQLERVRILRAQKERGEEDGVADSQSLKSEERDRAAPQCRGTEQKEDGQSNSQPQAAATDSKLHISASSISLPILTTPVDTPMTPGETVEMPTMKRQRSLSIQETEAILMGNTSDSDEEENDKPAVKRRRVGEANSQVLRGGDEEIQAEQSNDKKFSVDEEKKEEMEMKPTKEATWSARQNLGPRGPDQRWRAHQIAEDYISLASSITLPPTYLGPFGYSPTTGQYPIEQVTALGYLQSPLRRPTVIEKWSPYEIATFEAAITLHGKHFHQIQKWVKTKCTKEIVEFYYIWKKTSHYQRWKNQYEEEIESSDEEEDVKGGGKPRLPVSPARRGRR